MAVWRKGGALTAPCTLCLVCCAQVLTIGATNLAQELDQALLRPGRFEVRLLCRSLQYVAVCCRLVLRSHAHHVVVSRFLNCSGCLAAGPPLTH
jgi:hypothetical protein